MFGMQPTKEAATSNSYGGLTNVGVSSLAIG